nr:TerC family protein [Gracilibacillus alcaliphilus]
MTFDWISLLHVIAIDIVLSGDNALIIAMATKNLPKQHQNKAILIGVAGAIILRILFASGVVFLLTYPFIYLIGGLLLIWIGYKLTKKEEETQTITSSSSVIGAVSTIILADVVMSLDNVVAIAGASKGHIGLLTFGVLVSIPLMIFGAKFIMLLLRRFPLLIYIGAAILVYTGVDMMMHEPFVHDLLQLQTGFITILLSLILTIGVVASGYATNKEINT